MNHPISKLRILFIEDSRDDAELAVRCLEKDGISVEWRIVATADALRETLAIWKPELILSDYSMPGFSGHDALMICRVLVPELPFIFLSGTIGEELAIESIHQGATDYVLKENIRRLPTSVRRAVSDAVEQRRILEMEKERLRLAAILEATSDCVAIALPDESLIYLNQGAHTLLGLAEGNSGLALKDIHPRQALKQIREHLQNSREPRGIWQGDSQVLHSDGHEIPVSLVLIAHRDAEDQLEYCSLIARDLRDRKAYEQQIQYLSHYDSLTGMPNRTLLGDRIAQAISYTHWTNRSVAVLVIDIDRFKFVNDGYGPAFGDELLKHFAARLRATARPRDTIARISADCFAILATELAVPEDAIILITRLQNELQQPFIIDGISLTVTAGIGVSIYPRDGNDHSTLIRNADVAMHRLKESGKGGFQFYTTEMTQNAEERVQLEQQLQHALSRGQLELYYQCQVHLVTQKIRGFEALMRWNHPERGLIGPDLFIPIAENSDLICRMGEWAVRTACAQIKQWTVISGSPLRIAVNVSVRQFLGSGFTDFIERTLAELGLAPEQLELEITESVLVQDQDEAALILQRLNTLGVQISLDDFGTGYSNLNYLSRLPIHCLKIDKSFVQRSSKDKNDMEIVRAVISLADSLGLRVIAEGIESRQQLDMLRIYHCNEGQGYYFARPQPATKVPLLLQAEIEHGNAFTPGA